MPEETNNVDENLKNEIKEAALKVHNTLLKNESLQTSDVVAYVLIFMLSLQSQDPELYNSIMSTLRANEPDDEEM